MLILNFKLPFSGFQYDKHAGIFASAESSTAFTKVQHSNFHRRFKCNFCSYSTNIKCNIKAHSLVHSGERPHKCEVCHQSFTQLQNLKRHMMLHTGEKPYVCNVCNESFRQARSLKLHMSKHL